MPPKAKAGAEPKAKAAAAPKKEEEAPKQETLEKEPLATASNVSSYGSLHKLNMTPEEMDAKMPKKMREICNDWIVGTHQFDMMENPAGTLVAARFLRAFIIFFIFTSTLGLIIGFVFKASLSAPMETEQYSELPAPSIVFCASPWGSDFLGFDVQEITEGVIPGTHFTPIPTSNWTVKDFNSSLGMESASWLNHCKYVHIDGINLHPLGKVAQYSGFETMRVSVNAQTEDGKFNFGFCNDDNEMPQRWNYGSLGQRIRGEVRYDQVNVGASDVSEGTPRSILGFSTSGIENTGGNTILEYYYGYFMIRLLSAQAKGLTLFSIVAFALLLAAAVNNCGLFDLFFVEYVEDGEPPPQMEPALWVAMTCGKCCTSCRRRKGDAEAEDQAAEGEEKA